MVQNKGKKVDPNNPFQKRKQKVGKKKLKPVNATSAEIHSQTIFIKKQTRDPDSGVYTNEKNQTFKGCLTKLGHYSGVVRKEGLLSLHGMVRATLEGAAAAVPTSSHATLLNAALPLLNDADVEVRKAVVALLKITLALLEREGTARTLLPLVVRFLTVALTHLDAPVRASACRALKEVCVSPCAAALPEAFMLLDCCHGMLAAASRPFDRVQPPALQTYLALLRSCLLRDADTKPLALFATAAPTKHNPQTAGAVGVDAHGEQLMVVPSTLATQQAVTKYLTEPVAEMIFDHWVEAVQDAGRATRVGSWELGLLEVLNSLVTALAARQTGAANRPLPKRMAGLPRTFKDKVAKMAGYFPFSGGSAEALRVNIQLALLLSCFLPNHGEAIRAWVKKLVQKAAGIRQARPVDVQALAVILERLGKYAAPTPTQVQGEGADTTNDPPASKRRKAETSWGDVLALPVVESRRVVGTTGGDLYADLDPTAANPMTMAAAERGEFAAPAAAAEQQPPMAPEDAAPAGVEEGLLAALYTSCGAVGTAVTNEVLSAVDRRMELLSQTSRAYPQSLLLCMADAPRVLFELAAKLQEPEGEGDAAASAARRAAAAGGGGVAAIVPLVDGGAIIRTRDGNDPALRAVLLFVRMLLRYFNAAGGSDDGLPATLRKDLVPALFGVPGVAPGLLAPLARKSPDIAHTTLSLLPFLVAGDASDDSADDGEGGADADHILAAALASLPLDLSDAAAPSAAAPHDTAPALDALACYALELLSPYDLAGSFEPLDALARSEVLPAAAAAAKAILSEYGCEAEEAVEDDGDDDDADA